MQGVNINPSRPVMLVIANLKSHTTSTMPDKADNSLIKPLITYMLYLISYISSFIDAMICLIITINGGCLLLFPMAWIPLVLAPRCSFSTLAQQMALQWLWPYLSSAPPGNTLLMADPVGSFECSNFH